MYESILEYIVNADLFYRLWMVAEMQNPTPEFPSMGGPNKTNISQPRAEWFPDLVSQFEDVRLVPSVICGSDGKHNLDSDMRFHTGNKEPTIHAAKLELFWGCEREDVFRQQKSGRGSFKIPMRVSGPAYISLVGLKMWHHQDTLNRRRGDAIICEQATFSWNTKRTTKTFRESGPFQIIIKGFRAAYNMGVSTSASYAHLGVSWGTETGIRLGEEKVQEVINKNGIDVNYLLTDSAFSDEGEEFIFWDEIGRVQEGAA